MSDAHLEAVGAGYMAIFSTWPAKRINPLLLEKLIIESAQVLNSFSRSFRRREGQSLPADLIRLHNSNVASPSSLQVFMRHRRLELYALKFAPRSLIYH